MGVDLGVAGLAEEDEEDLSSHVEGGEKGRCGPHQPDDLIMVEGMG